MTALTKRQLFALARAGFSELLREKILWSALVFGVFASALSWLVSTLSFAENARIAMDFGLTAIALTGGLVSIMMGSILIAREIERRHHYTILSKPVDRWQFVVGRAAGLGGVVALNATLMALIVVAIVLASGGRIDLLFVQAFILQLLEFTILCAIASVFSSFSTPALATIITTGIWVCGHAMEDIRILSEKTEPAGVRPLLKLVTWIVPDLTRFDLKAEVSHAVPILWSTFGLSILYGVVVTAFFLGLACVLFTRREL